MPRLADELTIERQSNEVSRTSTCQALQLSRHLLILDMVLAYYPRGGISDRCEVSKLVSTSKLILI